MSSQQSSKLQNNKIVMLESCHKCGQVIREEWNYCPKCETKLSTDQCPFCVQDIKSSWEYCPHCKNNLKEYFDHDYNTANDWLRSILSSKRET